ncbi:MAG: hypothetical protein JEY96_19560 [Bacteroidales bacterium]|nr:hypothetical protein [Bacteroidales bacterium]
MKSKILKLTIYLFFSFLTVNSFSQTLNEIDFSSFSYYNVDSVNYKMTGILNTGETVIINLTESFYIDDAKFLISKELGVVEKNKAELVSLVMRLHHLLLNDKLHTNFRKLHKDYEFLDEDVSRYGVTAIDNFGVILQEINMETLVLIIYKEWTY